MALIGWHTQFAGRSQPGEGKRDPKVGVRSSEHLGLQSSDRLTSRAFPASLARLA